jgi:hypothetical protein
MQKLLCNNCKHYALSLSCRAYPLGIPEEILIGDDNHSKVKIGQIGDFIFSPTKRYRELIKHDKT